jgi:hypothetical protein
MALPLLASNCGCKILLLRSQLFWRDDCIDRLSVDSACTVASFKFLRGIGDLLFHPRSNDTLSENSNGSKEVSDIGALGKHETQILKIVAGLTPRAIVGN